MARIVIGRSEFWLRKIQEKKGGKARNALPPKQQIKPKETGQNQWESLAIDLELNFTGVTGKLLKLFRAERNKMYQGALGKAAGNLWLKFSTLDRGEPIGRSLRKSN